MLTIKRNMIVISISAHTCAHTEGGETTAANWKWFAAMDEVMGQSHREELQHSYRTPLYALLPL